MSVIDLSHIMTSGMPVYPGTPHAILKPVYTLKNDGFNELQLTITTHTGTHIDCPFHIIEDGFTTSTDINRFYGGAIVIDCRETGSTIPLSVFEHIDELISGVEFIILFTGWDKYWGRPGYFKDYPVLDAGAAGYLANQNLKGVGIDAPSFDHFGEDLPVHHKLLGSGKILIENLTNLISVSRVSFDFSCFPLYLHHGDGSPVRAAAIIK